MVAVLPSTSVVTSAPSMFSSLVVVVVVPLTRSSQLVVPSAARCRSSSSPFSSDGAHVDHAAQERQHLDLDVGASDAGERGVPEPLGVGERYLADRDAGPGEHRGLEIARDLEIPPGLLPDLVLDGVAEVVPVDEVDERDHPDADHQHEHADGDREPLQNFH